MKPTEARALLFLHYVSWPLLIVAQTSKFRLPEMIALGPLKIFNLGNEFRPNPNTFLHIVSS